MAFDKRAKARYFSGMRRRISELKSKSETSMDFAIDTMMMERVESYIHVENGLEEVERMIGIEHDNASVGRKSRRVWTSGWRI